MNKKRVLFFTIIGLVFVLVAFLVYRFFFSPQASAPINEGGNPFLDTGTDIPRNVRPALEVGESLRGAGKEVAPRLIQITDEPVAFGTLMIDEERTLTSEEVFDEELGTTTLRTIENPADTQIRYLERATGNLYSFRANERTLTRLTNRTLPGIIEVSWNADGSIIFPRFISPNNEGIENVETLLLPESGEGGFLLEKNIKQVLPVGTSTIFTFVSSKTGSVGTLLNEEGRSIRQLFSTPLSLIRIFPSSDDVFAVNDPSAGRSGYLLLLQDTPQVFTPILGPLAGLSILPSPSGRSILYSTVSGRTVSLFLFDVGTRISTRLPLATVVEKCVWRKTEVSVYCGVPRTVPVGLPDTWYRGEVSTSDRIWEIRLDDRLAKLLIDPEEVADTPIDISHMNINENGTVLTFSNKTDLSLWAYILED